MPRAAAVFALDAAARSAPYVLRDDAVALERLPVKPGDPMSASTTSS
jgi:hypothetical protein